jgi:hypothetical protein
VVFVSFATNLVAGDTNGKRDIFLRDTQENTTTRISVATDGTEGDNYSTTPSVSADGRYVVFSSYATNLVAGDTNGFNDIFCALKVIIPTMTTESASSASLTTVTLSGAISDTGGENITVRGFNYGIDTSYGLTVSETGTFGAGSYSLNVSDLTCGTTYHYKSFATNSVDTGYGLDKTFETNECARQVSGGGYSQSSFIGYLLAQIASLKAQIATFPDTASAGSQSTTAGFTFTKNLKLNDIDSDVKQLQIFLNTHGFKLADTGPGSPGNETTKFGVITKNAVIKFQEAYFDEILKPQGLKQGTGMFYNYSRAVANKLLSKYNK